MTGRRFTFITIVFAALTVWLAIALTHDLAVALALGRSGVLAWMYP